VGFTDRRVSLSHWACIVVSLARERARETAVCVCVIGRLSLSLLLSLSLSLAVSGSGPVSLDVQRVVHIYSFVELSAFH